MSGSRTTPRHHSVWPIAILLLPAALLIGNLGGVWVSRHASGFQVFSKLAHEADAAMEMFDPLGLAKLIHTAMEETVNGK